MIGFKRKDVSIVVCHLPYRKKACLAIQEDNVLTKVASFNNEHSAKLFLDKLAVLTGADALTAEDWEKYMRG